MINRIYEILKPLGIKIKYLNYTGPEKIYITYRNMDNDRLNYEDDRYTSKESLWQFDIWSKEHISQDLIEDVEKLLEDNGFIWDDEKGEDYLTDIEEYWVALRFYFEYRKDD